jgi:DNA polymerase III epsilon subunit-like protein
MNTSNLEAKQFRRIVVADIETISLNPTEPKGALDALTGRIVCIGLLIDDGEQITERAIIEQDEKLILERFWEALRPTDVLVGHNILEFDLPFIRQRSWVLGILPSRTLDLRKYYTGEVTDTMQVWTNWGYKKGVTLDNLGAALGCGVKTGHGQDVARWWAARDLRSIAAYCMDDVRLTYRVFCKLMYLPDRLAAQLSALSVA